MKKSLLLWSALAVGLGGIVAQVGEDIESKLERTISTVPPAKSADDQFVGILQAGDVPGGAATIHFECADTAMPAARLPDNVALSRTLDSLLTNDVLHRWEPLNGVILLLPRGGVPNFLRTRLSHVHLSDLGNRDQSLHELLSTDEVLKAQVALRLVPQRAEIGFQKLHRGSGETSPQPVDLAETTLLDALNRLAVSRGNGIWRYDEYHCAVHTFKISFVVW